MQVPSDFLLGETWHAKWGSRKGGKDSKTMHALARVGTKMGLFSREDLDTVIY